jgi:hypothetical protein
MSRHNLFFAPEQEIDDFRGVLQQVQTLRQSWKQRSPS